MENRYDIITIGGGLAGASFAQVMAARGARVLVLERETRFKDRVRGEALFPWGAAELETLGLRRLLLSTCATENRWWDDYLGPDQVGHRDTAADTPGGTATLTFYHPDMQEALLAHAVKNGTDCLGPPREFIFSGYFWAMFSMPATTPAPSPHAARPK